MVLLALYVVRLVVGELGLAGLLLLAQLLVSWDCGRGRGWGRTNKSREGQRMDECGWLDYRICVDVGCLDKAGAGAGRRGRVYFQEQQPANGGTGVFLTEEGLGFR